MGLNLSDVEALNPGIEISSKAPLDNFKMLLSLLS
jgi:hypothetical protein